VDAFMCYKKKCKVVSLNLAHPVYNIPDTGCLECYRPHASVDTTTPGIDRKRINCRNMP